MLTELDKKILNHLQGCLPISSRPFADIAANIGVTEEEVIARLRYLKEKGLIRKIGLYFDSLKLGYTGTLVAIKARQDALQEIAETINLYPEITHNYERYSDDNFDCYNLWFTLLTAGLARQEEILQQIKNLPGVERMANFPAEKRYKVDVQFAL